MRPILAVTTALVASSLVAAGPVVPSSQDPVQERVQDRVAGCDDLDPALCLLPFPNDLFTVEDDGTATGRRVAFSPAAMPRNVAGKPIDPTEWNRNDGFSPGSMVLTHVPGLDLAATFGTHVDNLADPDRYLAPDAPMVVLDAETGQRHPVWAELDQHAGTPDDQRLLILRPLVNFREGHRYIVALRDLRDSNGDVIEAGSSFRRFRDGPPGNPAAGRASSSSRASHYEDLFATLADAGIARGDLHLAWDFTVASGDNLAGRVLAMRDDAFAQLGDANLGDGVVDGDAPAFTVDYVDEADGNSLRVVHGAVTVPNYLDRPQPTLDLGRYDRQGHDVPAVTAPGSRLYYGTAVPGPMDTPVQNPAAPTMEVPFACAIPTTTVGQSGDVVNPAIPVLYGHGLLGQRIEGAYWSGGRHMLTRHNAMNCGVDWIGMAQQDLANVATVLADPSNFPSVADRVQQGLLGFLLVGRAMIHEDGFSSHPAFRADGHSLFDTTELFYDGNSQGGIMGGALTAIAPDFTKAVLGVPGMNYSTLLNRSVDWEGSYGEVYYAFQHDPMQRQLSFALLQMLWDRAESNGYAQHITDEPYANTPAHQVLLHVAFGDYQVANVAAEVMGRTVGASLLHTSLAPDRHWSDDPTFGFSTFEDRTHTGSALVYFDSGNLTPPNANVPPPEHRGDDPHGHPRADVLGGVQKRHFYDTGVVVDTRGGEPYLTRWCDDDEAPVPCDAPNDAP